jgi:ribose 1,5-bisphosphokinase
MRHNDGSHRCRTVALRRSRYLRSPHLGRISSCLNRFLWGRSLSGAKLIYTVGPSGAGKDSLLAWLRTRMPSQFKLHFARRCITRIAQPHGELHESVDTDTFHRLLAADAFALHWQANGLHYGVRHEELAPLQSGKWVIVNGSRAYLADALHRFPDLRVLHVSASEETLRMRLLARGRETPEAIESRVTRSIALSPPEWVPTIEVRNEGSLDAAGDFLLRSLRDLMLPPVGCDGQ